MVKMRMKNQDRQEGPHHNREYWNEVIVDLTSWEEILKSRPNDVVMAFVYPKDNGTGKRIARGMRDKFVDMYNVKTKPPLIAIDIWADPKKTKNIFNPGE